MNRRATILSNVALFQVGWLLCVLGGAGSWHWASSVLVFALVLFHLHHASKPAAELRLILLAIAIGLIWDSLLVSTQLLDYPHGQYTDFLAPHWIIAMWALFATTINVSLRWLRGRALLAVIFGCLGGPMAYWAGQKLGAVNIPDEILAFTTLAIGWAVITPLLVKVSSRFDGYSHLEGAKSA